jgi:hypothetical protein
MAPAALSAPRLGDLQGFDGAAASWRVPRATLALALAVSLTLHGLTLSLERRARAPGQDGARLTATLRPATQPAQPDPGSAPMQAAEPGTAESPLPRASDPAAEPLTRTTAAQRTPPFAPPAETTTARAAAPGANAWLGLDTPEPVPLPNFDPTAYLPPSRVQTVAQPYDDDLLDNLPLSGAVPGRWTVRIFIGEHGRIDRLDIVAGQGAAHNEEELRAVLRAAPFRPATNAGAAVRSQRTLVISFDPQQTAEPGGIAPQGTATQEMGAIGNGNRGTVFPGAAPGAISAPEPARPPAAPHPSPGPSATGK